MTSGWEKDIAGYALAKTLHRDIQQFKSFGLNGVSSCQAQRVFFPTGLAMTVLVQTLWNDQLRFEDISRNYFNNAFGQDGSHAETFLATLSDLFDPAYLQLEKPRIDPVAVKRFASIPDYIRTFIPTIMSNLDHPDTCVRTNWRNLNIYCTLMGDCACMFQDLAKGEKKKRIYCKAYLT